MVIVHMIFLQDELNFPNLQYIIVMSSGVGKIEILYNMYILGLPYSIQTGNNIHVSCPLYYVCGTFPIMRDA